LIAVVAVVLVSTSAVIAGYIYASRPVQSQLEIIAEDRAIPSLPETRLMILCPSKAREMGLCTLDERDLFTKYALTVDATPAPRGDVSVSCRLVLSMLAVPPLTSPAGAWVNLTTIEIDKTSDFICNLVQTDEDRFELDLAFIGDPDDAQLISRYVLFVTIDYDEPLLPGMPLITRNIHGSNLGDICILGYDARRHPPAGASQSDDPLGGFRSCDDAVIYQKMMLGIPLVWLSEGISTGVAKRPRTQQSPDRLPRQLIDLTLASGVGAGDRANRIHQSQSIQATIHFQRRQGVSDMESRGSED